MKPVTMIAALLVAALLLASAAARAQERLDRIDDWSEASGWEGVGLLWIGGRSTCTGALIESDLVLTAAHCVYDEGGRLQEPASIEFRAAWRNGRAISRRTGRQILAHPDYVPTDAPSGATIFDDLALIRLDQPIAAETARPFPTGPRMAEGGAISVVSYGAGRNDAATLERDCRVARDFGGVYAMTCSVVPGSSGSPVFDLRDGTPRIVSVISALGVDGTAYGMDVSIHIGRLLADFRAGTGVYPAPVANGRRLTVGDRTQADRLPRRLTVGQQQPTGNGPLFLKP